MSPHGWLGQGALLAWLTETLRASRAVEVGVFTGYSALAVALVRPGSLLSPLPPHLAPPGAATRCNGYGRALSHP